MATYDAEWARNVYQTYAKLCARAQQINICIRQNAEFSHGRTLSLEAIKASLIWSIQHSSLQRRWTDYKRLCRKTPLDETLLNRVTKDIIEAGEEIDVEKKQRQFDFA